MKETPLEVFDQLFGEDSKYRVSANYTKEELAEIDTVLRKNFDTIRRKERRKYLILGSISFVFCLSFGIYAFISTRPDVFTAAGTPGSLTQVTEFPYGHVTLKGSSKIKVVDAHSAKPKIYLQGEAEFDVPIGREFIIHTEHAIAYIKNGKAIIYSKNEFEFYNSADGDLIVIRKSDKNRIVLKHGSELQILDGNINVQSITQSPSNPNIINYDNKPLRYVIDDLQQIYNITITSVGVDDTRLVSGMFQHDDTPLKVLEYLLPPTIDVKQEGNKITLSNRDKL